MVYLEVEIYENTDFTVSVRPNKGSWISKTVTATGAGLKTISFTINRTGGLGNYHTVKIASNSQFRLHSVDGLLIVKSLGVKRR